MDRQHLDRLRVRFEAAAALLVGRVLARFGDLPAQPCPRREGVELERRPVRSVEPPSDPAVRDPLLEAGDVVVVESEPAAHRLAVDHVEDLGRGHALRAELDQPGDHAEYGVRLSQRPVGEADA